MKEESTPNTIVFSRPAMLKDLAEPVVIMTGKDSKSKISRLFPMKSSGNAVIVELETPDSEKKETAFMMGASGSYNVVDILSGEISVTDAYREMENGHITSAGDVLLVKTNGRYGLLRKSVIEREALIYLERAASNINKLTKLPGSVALGEELDLLFFLKREFSIVYADIDGFGAFNRKYGFSKGNDVLLSFSDAIKNIVVEMLSYGRYCFAGHTGGDDFIIIADAAWVDMASNKLRESFVELAGHQLGKNVDLGLSLAVLTPLTGISTASTICKELSDLMREARQISGHGYIKSDGISKHNVRFADSDPALMKS